MRDLTRQEAEEAYERGIKGVTAKPGPLVEQLRDHIGLWVAVKGDKVLTAANTPGDIIEWLRENGETADSCFRVPAIDPAVGGDPELR